MTVPPRIQRLLDGGHLEVIDAPDSDIEALWQKAVTSARDARGEQLSVDNQYVLGYQALLQVAAAILAAAGYRTRGAQGHHANTFYAVAGLGIEGLEDIDVRTERIRRIRKLSAYEPGSPTPEQVGRLLELVQASIHPAHRWLAGARPEAHLGEVSH